MEEVKSKVVDFVKGNKKALIAVGAVAALACLKNYFRGGVCRVNRDLSGQVVVVTGGNSGIGKETVEQLAKRGCTIIIGARDHVKSEKVLANVQANNPECQIFFIPLDLADKKSIQEFVDRIKETCDCVNILINNAGVITPQRRQTKDGFQMMMGTNHLGHFYLTHLLWKLIKAAPVPRIINVSSLGHEKTKSQRNLVLDFGDLNQKNHFDSETVYCRSKLANILFTKRLQAKISQAGINGYVMSLHPGIIVTQLIRDLGSHWRVMKVVLFPLTSILFKTAWQGAQTTLYLALEDAQKLQKGEYYKDCKRVPSSPFSSDMRNAQRLWKLSEEMLGVKFNV